MDLKEQIAEICGDCNTEGVRYESMGKKAADQILSLVREEIEKHQLTDDEIHGVDRPCLRDEPCPFGIADEPCDAEGDEGRCVLCHERELTKAQIQSILKALGGE